MYEDLIKGLLKIFVIVFVTILYYPLDQYFEERVSFLVRQRKGCRSIRAHFFIKAVKVFKSLWGQSIYPLNANVFMFEAVPNVVFIISFLPLLILPIFAPINFSNSVFTWELVQHEWGLLLGFIFLSIVPLGFVLLGWSSGNLQSLRSSITFLNQNLCYDLVILLIFLTLYLSYGSFELHAIVAYQQIPLLGTIPSFGVFLQPLAALLFFIGILVKSSSHPFQMKSNVIGDSSVNNQEHQIFSTLLIQLSSYVYRLGLIGFFVLIFLGGYGLLPGLEDVGQEWLILIQAATFLLKIVLVSIFVHWIRWTIPLFQTGEMISFCWKKIFPLAMVNVLIVVGALYLSKVV